MAKLWQSLAKDAIFLGRLCRVEGLFKNACYLFGVAKMVLLYHENSSIFFPREENLGGGYRNHVIDMTWSKYCYIVEKASFFSHMAEISHQVLQQNIYRGGMAGKCSLCLKKECDLGDKVEMLPYATNEMFLVDVIAMLPSCRGINNILSRW